MKTLAFVADASVGVSWVIQSQSTPETDRLPGDISTGLPFVVPGLWNLEIAQTLIVMLRRNRIREEQYRAGLDLFAKLNPIVDDEGPRLAFTRVSELAAEYKLTVYDAVCLELALRRGLPLASRDTDLNRAAALIGLKMPASIVHTQ